VAIFGLPGPVWFELISSSRISGRQISGVGTKLPLEKINQARVGMAVAIGRATRNAAPL
jgi:hypothetical protein